MNPEEPDEERRKLNKIFLYLHTLRGLNLWLLLRMLAWASILPALKHIMPLQSLVRLMWAKPVKSERPAEGKDSITVLVGLIYGRFYTERNCLERSLLLYRYLSMNRVCPELLVGMEKVGDEWRGHAWVLADGRPVGEPESELKKFTPLFTYGDRAIMQRLAADQREAAGKTVP